MRRWRKMTWAILIWTAFFVWWGVAGVGAVSNECTGLAGNDLALCQGATAVGSGIGLTLVFGLWFVGFVVLALVWFMSRPKTTVVVYGPDGQQATVAETEAKRRVDKQGWTYTPRSG